MDIKELSKILEELGIPANDYYLHGLYGSTNDEDKVSLVIRRGAFFIEYHVYYKERGGINSLKVFTDENEALLAFHSVLLVFTSAQLRALLVLLTVEGFPTLCIIQNEELFKTLYDDYLHFDSECRGNVELSKNKCLLDLKRRFDVHGKDIMHACGFPTPIPTTEMTELERIRLKYKPEEQKAKLERTMACAPNTPEQEAVFEQIKEH
jgi:hypothetical protein